MIFSNFKIFFDFMAVSTTNVDLSFIYIQPRIIKPTFSKTHSYINASLETHYILVEEEDRRNLSLEFTINYHSFYGSFKLLKTGVLMRKYIKKKTDWEVYDSSIHKPTTIQLPSKDEEYKGFKLEFSEVKYVETKNDGSDFAFQSVSLVNIIKINTIDDFKNAVEQLKDLLDITDVSNLSEIAFQFIIEIKRHIYSGKLYDKQRLYTEFFTFDFSQIDENTVSVILLGKPSNTYHLVSDTHLKIPKQCSLIDPSRDIINTRESRCIIV